MVFSIIRRINKNAIRQPKRRIAQKERPVALCAIVPTLFRQGLSATKASDEYAQYISKRIWALGFAMLLVFDGI